MKRPTDRSADARLARKRALIRSLIEQARHADADPVDETAPVAVFRVVGADIDEAPPRSGQALAEIIPFPVDAVR